MQHGCCALVCHSIQPQVVPQSCGFTNPDGVPRGAENGIPQTDRKSEEEPAPVSACGKRSAQASLESELGARCSRATLRFSDAFASAMLPCIARHKIEALCV